MKELDECIKTFSLIFTNTITRLDFCHKGFDLNNIMVNFDNSISLYDLIEKFNKLYLSFKKEYSELDKFELGEHIQIGKFVKIEEYNYRHLSIYIDRPIINDTEYTNLYLVKRNNEYQSFITNDINSLDKKYYKHAINFDKQKVQNYLDLFEKYWILLYLYYHFKDEMIFGDGTHTLITKIESHNNEFLGDLDRFKVFLGSNYFTSADYFKLYVALGNNFNIDVRDCELKIDNNYILATYDNCLKILKNIYINEKYLNTYWDRVDHKEKVSAKSLIKKADNV